MTSISLDGSTWDPDFLIAPRVHSFSSVQRHAEARSALGPSALLGMAARACTSSVPDARAILRNEFGFSRARAISATKVGAALTGSFGTNTALGYLAGVKMTATQSSALMSLLHGTTQADGAPATLVSDDAVSKFWQRRKLGQLARKVARTKDQPSSAACAALLASRWNHPSSQGVVAALLDGLSGTFMGPKRPSDVQRAADRLLTAAYALSALSPDGLDLGTEAWAGAPADWRFRAAPWLLPLLEEEHASPAVTGLLAAASSRNLKFVQPGQTPFARDDSREFAEGARDLAAASAANLTKWTDSPLWFDGGPNEVQVLLTQDEDYAFAWVGRNGVGQLVAFDTTDFLGWGLDEPGMDQALTYAIAWYVDISVSLRKTQAGTSTLRRTTGGSKAKGISYKPTPTYATQRTGVIQGTHSSPNPHTRAAHVRDLVNRFPSEEALSNAPARIRKKMGLHDTWVRKSSVGAPGAQKEMKQYLSKYSMLANVIGLIDSGAGSSAH